jgi:thiol-disulfide isomerase/thioredoxin
MLAKVLEDVKVNTPIVEIDIDDNNVMAVKYGVRGVPTCILVDDEDVEVRRRAGVMTEEEFKQFIGE